MGRRLYILLVFAVVLCLAACGSPGGERTESRENGAGQENMEGQGTVPELEDMSSSLRNSSSPRNPADWENGISEEEQQILQERQGFDWRTEDWKLDETGDWGHNLYAASYIYGLTSEPQEAYADRSSSYRVLGTQVYSIDEYSISEDGAAGEFYYLNCYDSLTGEIWHRLLELPNPPELEQYGDCNVYYSSFDVQSEEELVLFLHVRAKEDGAPTQAYLAVHMSMEGEMLSVLDLYPALLAGGAQDCTCGQFWHSPGRVYVDREGCYYLLPISWEERSYGLSGRYAVDICVLDPSGEQIGSMKPRGGHSPALAMKTPAGEPVFIWLTGSGVKTNALMYYDKAAQEPKQLLKYDEYKWDYCWVSMLREDGYLYFMDCSGRMNRCDLYTGRREYCLGYGKLGLGNRPGHVLMFQGADGEPMFLDTMEGDIICRLSTEEPETDPVRLVSLTEDCSFLEKQAQQFSKTDMEHPVDVEKPTGDTEDYRTRKMAELVSGKGADIYYVTAADMRILYENDVLADMTGMLPAQLEEAVYPGVLDGGILNGQRIGLAPEARAVTMLVSGKYWDREGWTLEEMMDMVDAHPELAYPIICGQQYLDGYRLLRLLLFQDLDSTPFVDLKKGNCDFENPLFIRVLELTKRYDDRPIEISRDENMPQELMEAGDYAAVILLPMDFPNFNQMMSGVAQDCYQVGFPTDEGTGCYWQADYYLVVSRNAGNPERVYEYLAYLLEEKSQNGTLSPVRQDMLKQHIITDDTDENNPFQYSDDVGGYYPLETGPDGTVWQEDYEKMRFRSALVTKDTEHIQQIILEEVKDYFSGVKDANAAASLIQNRVQLYLQEQGVSQETLEESVQEKGGQADKKHPLT